MEVLLVSCGDVATEAGLRFLAQADEVTGWRRNSSKLPPAFDGHDVDLLNPAGWPQIDPATEVVVLTPVPVSRDVDGYERSYLQVAQELCVRLREQAPKLRRLIYVSSTAVMGGDDGEWVTEQAPVHASRDTAKVLARTEAALAGSGLPVTILRASGIYGPGRTRLIDLVVSGTAKVPAGSHWTNRIHRDDLAAAIVHVANLGDQAAELYLATDSTPAQLGEVYQFLAAELGMRLPGQEAGSSMRRAGDRRLDNSRLLASGLKLHYPSFIEGYRDILSGISSRHA
ncbi:NAD-dependent epimerase/dehydratase family protein [Glutamicibacter sp. JL.03c]|uniref:NAD-dependent epimerase/dehydratase family protein n=1 Tax=Glutamicibacter sp. JL.03c TaxID=2984842 RepID=UPI0021F79EDA|nr:NAD-dependent epimerase/dehydratase family protein [Glutamicibacter sp. JL.03c]UYQ77965.1 NAD-dependent epimerase/dehydratase family protein [Glutamicibacter sp. JL.03c]